MSYWRHRMKEEAGFTIIETMIVVSILTIVIGGIISLMQLTYAMNRHAGDGFQAQAEGRRVLSEMVRYLRPAENINSNEVPIVHATDVGKVIDMRIDTNKDKIPEIARFELDQTGEQIILWLDFQDGSGEYAYQTGSSTYLGTYGWGTDTTPTVPTLNGDPWDEKRVVASKVVNTDPGSGWSAQTQLTNANEDFRLFTFYGEDFDVPLNTVALENWQNYVRGVKIYVWSDIQPMKIPSPFGIQTNVHLRNVQGE